jgi:hypothetical protein
MNIEDLLLRVIYYGGVFLIGALGIFVYMLLYIGRSWREIKNKSNLVGLTLSSIIFLVVSFVLVIIPLKEIAAVYKDYSSKDYITSSCTLVNFPRSSRYNTLVIDTTRYEIPVFSGLQIMKLLNKGM